MNGKKNNIKKRVIASFLVSVILVFCIPLNVFAYRYDADFSDGESALTYFGLNDTPMFNMIDSGQAFIQTSDNVNDYNNLSMFGLTSSNESDYEGYFNEVKQFSDFNVYMTINPDSGDTPSDPIDLSSSTYHLLTVFNNGSDTYAYMYYFWAEDGKPVYVVAGPQGNYIASEGTLHCWANEISSSQNDALARNYDSYVNVNNDGVNYVSYGTSIREYFVFTDMSVYNATDSGNSGFTNSGFSGGTADFDFDNVSSYYDFNLPKTSGDFIDPNAPVQPPAEETLAKYYMKFSDTTYYSGSDIMNMFHVNTFTFNEYQVQHPEQYKLQFHYQIALNAHSNAGIMDWPLDNYYYYDAVVDVASMMAQNKRHNSPSVVAVNISANLFNTSDGQHNLRDVLKNVVHEVDGTSTEVADPGTIFDQSAVVQTVQNWGDLVGQFFYSTENIPKSLPPVVLNRFVNSTSQFAIHDMRITCEVRLMDANNSNNHSYPFKDYYDFVRGDYKVISTMSTDEVNQLPEVLNDAPLVNNNGGGGATNNGTVVNNYITGATGGGAELVKVWTPFTLSEVSYSNTHGMFQDILEFMDAESENGFLPVVRQFFSYLPDTIWTYLTISIAVICGFAVVRFVLKR